MKTLIALDENGNRVYIGDAIKGNTYYDQISGTPMFVRHGIERKKHFAHKADSYSGDRGDMSDWHREWQERFPIECIEVVLEKDGVKHRADVLVNNIVIEFQHSPISHEDFTARNEFYTSLGYYVFWVFDFTDKIKADSQGNTVSFKRKQLQFDQFDTIDGKVHVFFETYIENFSNTRLIDLVKGKYTLEAENNSFVFGANSMTIDRCHFFCLWNIPKFVEWVPNSIPKKNQPSDFQEPTPQEQLVAYPNQRRPLYPNQRRSESERREIARAFQSCRTGLSRRSVRPPRTRKHR